MDLTKFKQLGYIPTFSELDKLGEYLLSLEEAEFTRTVRSLLLLPHEFTPVNMHLNGAHYVNPYASSTPLMQLLAQWRNPGENQNGPIVYRSEDVLRARAARLKPFVAEPTSESLATIVKELTDTQIDQFILAETAAEIEAICSAASPEDREAYAHQLWCATRFELSQIKDPAVKERVQAIRTSRTNELEYRRLQAVYKYQHVRNSAAAAERLLLDPSNVSAARSLRQFLDTQIKRFNELEDLATLVCAAASPEDHNAYATALWDRTNYAP